MDLIRIENVRGKERPVYNFTTREDAIKFSKKYIAKHGKGAPPVFIKEDGSRVRVQFDKKGTGTLRDIDTKTGSRGVSTSLRDVDLENTTLDPAMRSGKGFASVQNVGPVHHAAAARVVGKMHRQFELNQNPNWNPSDGPTPEGKTFLRNIQNRTGIGATGNNPVNLRPYPADNPSKPTVSDVHDEAHRMGRRLNIDPQTVNFEGYSNDDLFKYAKNTLAPSIKEIDDTLGFVSPVKSVGQAGAIARGKQPTVPGIEFKNSPFTPFRQANQAKRIQNLRKTARLAAGAGVLGVGFLGTAASASETATRTQIASETGDIADKIQAGISGISLAADVATYNPLTAIPGTVISTGADVINLSIDAFRQGMYNKRIRGRSGAQKAQQGT